MRRSECIEQRPAKVKRPEVVDGMEDVVGDRYGDEEKREGVNRAMA